MGYFKDILSTGIIRCLSKIYASEFVGKLTGNADSATKLATARTIQTNLASTSSASFNGTGNITPGVTGVLPVGNGGTGTNNGSIVTNYPIEVGSIEMNGGGSGTGGYIDFHYNGNDIDHTSRIIEDSYGHISLTTKDGGADVYRYLNVMSGSDGYPRYGIDNYPGTITSVTEAAPGTAYMLWAW